VRKPLIVMGALSAVVLAGPVALPMGAAAALPKVADTAIPSVGPFPAVSGYARTLRGDITLGWHGPPPAGGVALPKDTAIRSVGPFPAVSGYVRTLRGDITLGWHGPPPAGGVTNRSMLQSASHKPPRRPGARARHRSGWG